MSNGRKRNWWPVVLIILGAFFLARAYVISTPIPPNTGLINPVPLPYLGQVQHWEEQVEAIEARESDPEDGLSRGITASTERNLRLAWIYLIVSTVLGLSFIAAGGFLWRRRPLETEDEG